MPDHPKTSDPKGVNPSGQGPAQPKDFNATDKPRDTKQPGAATAGLNQDAEAEADQDTYD